MATTFNTAATINQTLLITDLTKSSLSTEFTTVKLLDEDDKQLFCDMITERDIDWPQTEFGMMARVSCPIGSTGYAEWTCGSNGRWESDGPDLSRCISTWSK
ncbi:hypothetical protein WUBG_15177, partial [Wuchereria bancrofti]